VEDSDPRVPRTVEAAKKQRKVWLPIGSQANTDGGYYRRDLDMNTAKSAPPTFTATWHPTNGPMSTLARASVDHAYYACVRHCQASCNA